MAPCADARRARKIALKFDPVICCKCRTELEDCPHVKRQKEHLLSLMRWAALLRLAFPGEYVEPPVPALPAVEVLHQSGAVEVYRRRVRARCHLYHPADPWRKRDARDGELGEEVEPTLFDALMEELKEHPRAFCDCELLPPVPGESEQERQRRERHNRVNARLAWLRRGERVAYEQAPFDEQLHAAVLAVLARERTRHGLCDDADD